MARYATGTVTEIRFQRVSTQSIPAPPSRLQTRELVATKPRRLPLPRKEHCSLTVYLKHAISGVSRHCIITNIPWPPKGPTSFYFLCLYSWHNTRKHSHWVYWVFFSVGGLFLPNVRPHYMQINRIEAFRLSIDGGVVRTGISQTWNVLSCWKSWVQTPAGSNLECFVLLSESY